MILIPAKRFYSRSTICAAILAMSWTFGSFSVSNVSAANGIACKPAVMSDSPQEQGLDQAASLLPSSTILHARFGNARDLIESILKHPLREKIEEIEDVKKAMKSHEFKQAIVARRMLEYQLEMEWGEILDGLTGQGLTVSFDGKTQAFVVMANAKDEDSLKDMVAKLFELAGDFKKLNVPVEIKKTNYQSLTTYRMGPLQVGVLGNVLAVSNNVELARDVADRYLDRDSSSLADNKKFIDSRQMMDSNVDGVLFVDLEAIRKAGIAKELFEEKTENIGVEALIGGLQSNLRNAPFAVVELQLDANDLTVQAKTPHNTNWINKSREFFFGPQGRGEAPAMLVPENAILNITSHRDFADLWLAKEDLFEEGHIAELAQADSQLSTFFSGLDFGEEILGAAKPGIQIVSALQDFSKLSTPQPNIKLPSFAVIFELDESAKIQRRFKMAFQSVVGIFNINLAQEGLPQLDIETETLEDGKVVTTMYVAENEDEEGLINYNFSPTIAFVGDYFIVSSTSELAQDLIGLARKGGKSVPAKTNTLVNLEAPTLKTVLAANREVLISQTMLEEGLDRPEAEKQIELLLSLLDVAKNATLKLEHSESQIELKMKIDFVDTIAERQKSSKRGRSEK